MVIKIKKARHVDVLRKLGLYETICFTGNTEFIRWVLDNEKLTGYVKIDFSEPFEVNMSINKASYDVMIDKQ